MKGDKPIELRVTSDGSPTLFCSEIDECYHSVHGARTESEYIFLKHGFDFVDKSCVRIFEVGFGTGLNMLLTALLRPGREIVYHAIEKYPVMTEVSKKYIATLLDEEERKLMSRIYELPWGEDVALTDNMTIRKIESDMTQVQLVGPYDVVYFDAFSPDKQSEMWSEEVFRKCFDALERGGVLVTYCSKGIVKTALRNVGFEVRRYDGPPGKRHIVVAFKK